MFESNVAGTLVATHAKPYKAFGDRPAGITYWAYVVPEFDQAPQAVKLSANDIAIFNQLVEAGFGSYVDLNCSLRAQGNDVQALLSTVNEIVAAEQEKPNKRTTSRAA